MMRGMTRGAGASGSNDPGPGVEGWSGVARGLKKWGSEKLGRVAGPTSFLHLAHPLRFPLTRGRVA